LKLGNIFLDDDMQVKIGDFGLASRVGDNVKDLRGTPFYLAPEVVLVYCFLCEAADHRALF
jgi:serine/threonine protein kinase